MHLIEWNRYVIDLKMYMYIFFKGQIKMWDNKRA